MLQTILIGIGLSMDAAAVGMGDGLSEPKMKTNKVLLIALFFGVFQAVMPFIGYVAGSVFTTYITRFTPWLALILLSFIGGKMFADGIKENKCVKKESSSTNVPVIETMDNVEQNCPLSGTESDSTVKPLSLGQLCLQSLATAIDALAVGLVFVGKDFLRAIADFAVIGLTTFVISIVAVLVGKKFGELLGGKARIAGGVILIGIGLKIFIEYLVTIL